MSEYATARQLKKFDELCAEFWNAYWTLNHPYYADVRYNNNTPDDMRLLLNDLNNLYLHNSANRAPDWAVEFLEGNDLISWKLDTKLKKYTIRIHKCEKIEVVEEYVGVSHMRKHHVWGIIQKHFGLPVSPTFTPTEPAGFDNLWEKAMELGKESLTFDI